MSITRSEHGRRSLLEGLLRLVRGVLGRRVGRLVGGRCRGRDGDRLPLLGRGLANDLVDGRLENGDVVGKGLLRADKALRVPALHAEDG